MIRKAIFVTVFVAFAQSLSIGRSPFKLDAACAPDDFKSTKACLDSYFKGYGFDPAHLPSYHDFFANIIDITTKFGSGGVDIFCNYEVTLESCLGPLFSSDCMRTEAIHEMYDGMSWADAGKYSTDFQVRAFECDNKQFIKDNNDCFDDVVTNHLDERQQCKAQLDIDIEAVTDGDYCTPFIPFITCEQDVYAKYCGEKTRGYICQILQIGTIFDSKGICTTELPPCPSF